MNPCLAACIRSFVSLRFYVMAKSNITTSKDRSIVKRHQIAQTLRKAIVNGKYKPGQQLPTRVVLEARYRVSPETLQRSFDELKADGFLRAQRRGGTFVVDYPPHLHRYGLVMGTRQSDLGFPRFYGVLTEQAQALEKTGTRSMSVYQGVLDASDRKEHDQLIHDLEHQTLAGVIFCGFEPEQYKLYNVPKVIMGLHEKHGAGSYAYVGLSHDIYIKRAMDYFHSQGRRRLGVISVSGWEKYFQSSLIKISDQYGLTFEDHLMQMVSLRDCYTARRLVKLLMHPDHSKRPDALLVADDNILEYVHAGLVELGIRVPEDVTVVAHANFPSVGIANGLPMRRLGYDAREVIEHGLQFIDDMRQGQANLQPCYIPPRFEDEIQ